MTDNTDGFDTGIGIEEETGPESGMPSEGPDMTRDRPALFDGDTGDRDRAETRTLHRRQPVRQGVPVP